MIYPKGVFNGQYESTGDPATAQCVVAHEFAVSGGGQPGRANLAIADFILDNYSDLPVILGRPVLAAIQQKTSGFKPEHVFESEISADTTASVGGTWVELTEAKQAMARRGLERALHVGQAYHIGRVAAQAAKLGMRPIIPSNLPKDFDPDSSQWWCRNRMSWILRESAGFWVLRQRGQV